MNNELIKKIKSILEIYEDHNFPGKLWNIDTDIFNFLKRVSDVLINSKRDRFRKIKIEYIKNKDRYKLWIDELPISSSKSELLAWSTIRQYLQIFNALNYIDLNNKKINEIKNKGYYKFDLSFEFSNLLLLNSNSFSIKILINSIKTNISFIKNMGFSIFVCLIWKKDKSILLHDDLNKFKFEKIKAKDGYKFLDSKIRNNYIEKMYKETYFNLLRKIDSKSIIEIINLIFHYSFKYYDYFLHVSKTSINYNELNISNLFQSGRGFLRNRIIENRNLKNDKFYTDIEFLDENNNWINLMWPIDQSEAAHIISVKDLKNWEISFNKNEEISKEKIHDKVSNYDNGLLIPEHYHKAYDKNKFFFNDKGIAIIRSQFVKEFEIMGIKKFRIKESIFNEKMKQNIQNR